MAYRLKKIKYLAKDNHILMQNENGPCPLLAAVNCLLLRRTMELPSTCVKAGVITIEELVNILADRVLINTSKSSGASPEKQQVKPEEKKYPKEGVLIDLFSDMSEKFRDVTSTFSRSESSECDANTSKIIEKMESTSLAEPTPQEQQTQFAVQEVLEIFPSLQFGMDVNPKFTSGPSGVEYTKHLNAFDLLHVDLVHGWLIDGENEESLNQIVGKQTYNQLVNQVIRGNEAQSELEKMLLQQGHARIGTSSGDTGTPGEEYKIQKRKEELTALATNGSIIHNFLEHSSHQLTQYGLQRLNSRLKENELVVFFRNNHFNCMTKHKGFLYLLVTDLGYAAVDVCWERLDAIDGDTEFVTANFERPKPIATNASANTVATGEDLISRNTQANADLQLALQLSRETGTGGAPSSTNASARQDDMEAALRASLQEYEQQQKQAFAPSLSASLPPPTVVHGVFKDPPPAMIGAQVPANMPAELPARSTAPKSASNSLKPPPPPAPPTVAMGIPASIDDHDHLLAQRMQDDEAASMRLAMQLQQQEEELHKRRTTQSQRQQTTQQGTSQKSSSSDENCVIC